ncbi:hypothetical protein HFN01_13875 [Rhizobium leguminosarum]|uniref:hypothetical protein n=1 Tax=Rhizobium leguminosarum TaxID=384 RepID=UPI001C96E79E|nr:hypothetical protein [Rhizobium leguminosarum]MBY5395910.1 hypothetical protein [Rhizobium leguminosarum]
MTEDHQDKFTVYLDGHEGHRGNVLLHAFISKIQRLETVLGKMERAYLSVPSRQTQFEIVAAAKVNPTSLTLHAVPSAQNYDPKPAFQWTMRQIRAVSDGVEPDERVGLDIAKDLEKLSARDTNTGYKAFWINGFAEKVLFDENFHANAARLAFLRKKQIPDQQWQEGKSLGSIVGELKKLDDFEHDREFVIVPAVGDPVICIFPDAMRDEMGSFWRKVVRVTGILQYHASSPFPARVEVEEGGVQLYPEPAPRRTLAQMRGVFSGLRRPDVNWNSLFDG